jgi:hypothetical protein
MMTTLKALGNAFNNTELEIHDNKNLKLSLEACRGMANIERYESHFFKMHQAKGCHYIFGFQSLKRKAEVLGTLKKMDCYLKDHHWPQDKWDVLTLVEMDPGRHMSDEVREQMIDLAKAKECQTTLGPRFKLVAQRFKMKHNGTIFKADLYGVHYGMPMTYVT